VTISKRAEANLFKRRAESCPSARAALRTFLLRVGRSERPVLLPAYIGWSPREGSGVFDPFIETGTATAFYRVDSSLHVDVDDFAEALRRSRPCGVVLIHYFGSVDPSYSVLVQLAREQGAWVLEDEAHALLTDLVGGASGRFGDAAIFSLHKMLPVSAGGLLVWNSSELGDMTVEACKGSPEPFWEFDLASIALRRRANAEAWLKVLEPFSGRLRPLWGAPRTGEVPQSMPFTVLGPSRDALYHELNRVGVGVVSLYHTLIDQLRGSEYEASCRLSATIINFPVHQDAAPADILATASIVERSLERVWRAS
jgi:dTDP-4-amino-4,6-dideoxygalactose transaminase